MSQSSRCRFVLDNGSRCKNSQWAGGPHCWVHTFKVAPKPVGLIGLVVAVISFFLGAWAFRSSEVEFTEAEIQREEIADTAQKERSTIADTAQQQRNEVAEDAERQREQLADSARGQRQRLAEQVREEQERIAHVTRERPLPRIAGNRVQLISGLRAILAPGARGQPFRPHPLHYRVTEDGRLYISGALHDHNGVAVVRLVESRVFVPPGVEYDVNWSRSALEVVNGDTVPVLQVIATADRSGIVVNWVDAVPNSDNPGRYTMWQAWRDQMGAGGLRDTSTSLPGLIKMPGEPLEPIFCYPGYKYSGVLQKSGRC